MINAALRCIGQPDGFKGRQGGLVDLLNLRVCQRLVGATFKARADRALIFG